MRQHCRYPRRLCFTVSGQDFLFNLAAQTSHLDSMSAPEEDCSCSKHAGGQSRDRDRACRNTADLWPAAVPAGRRAASAAPGGRERCQQNGPRSLPPIVSRRLRDQEPLSEVDEGLRTKDARQTFLGIWVRRVIGGEPFEVWDVVTC